MAFGNASLPTRKFVYGVREFPVQPTRAVDPVTGRKAPRERFGGFDVVLYQMRLAGRFQNYLIELERIRRAATENTLLRHCPVLAQLHATATAESAAHGALQDQLKAANVVARATKSDPELARRARAQDAVANAAWRAYRAARTAAFQDAAVRAELDADAESDAEAKAWARNWFVARGLYWATAGQVTTRVKRTGPPPRFKRWEGEETISVQFQRKSDRNSPQVPVLDSKGNPRLHPRSGRPMMRHEGGGSLSTASIYTPNTLAWIERAPLVVPAALHGPLVPDAPEPCALARRIDQFEARWNRYVTVHFRCASDDTGAPVWCHLPTILHRPLPDGEVKWAHLSMRRIGTHSKFEVMFDVARPTWSDRHPAGAERATEGTVAVALGWRRIDGEIRVAEWVGSDGATDSVRIDPRVVDQWEALERLQSVRKTAFNEWRAGIESWLASRTDPLPDEWARRTASICRWESEARLAALVIWWRTNRLAGDADAFAAAEGALVCNRPAARDRYTGGRKQDKHLADWAANLRNRLTSWRKNLYRNLALELSRRYKSVVVGDTDWHEIAENPGPESVKDDVNKRFRALSACATLRDCLTARMDQIEVPDEGITITCNACGGRMPDPKRGRWVVCERCGGGRVDRAINAAKNLLDRGFAASSSAEPARVS